MAASARHVLSLPFDSLLRSKLICCGFSTVDDFKNYSSVDKLKRVVTITDDDAKLVLNVVGPYISNNDMLKPSSSTCGVFEGRLSSNFVMKSVACMLKENLKEVRHIVSFSSEVDKLMGGGFPLGRITEIAGEAGLGKTQFCFQLCVDVQIPACLGGVEGEAVYLDVEGTFFPQRMAQITNATVQHCHNVADVSESQQCIEAMKDFTTENVMSRIYLFSCKNCVQLLAATHQMRDFLKSHPKVKLLVVDSVAQCVRGEEDMRSRSKFLTTLGRIFQNIVVEFDVAVVLTNQVTTKINDREGTSYNIPALGMRWGHLSSVKLMLHKSNQSRYVHQYKSPDMKDGIAKYKVVSDGIRDVGDLNKSQEDVPNNTTTWKDYYNKRTGNNASCQENSSVQFYPITQGLASEMMTEWELHNDDNSEQTKQDPLPKCQNITFPKEEIPSKWVELSQRQLCEVDDPEVLDTDICMNKQEDQFVSGEENIDVVFDKENNSFETKTVGQNVESSQRIRQKTEAILKQTVETMLSSEIPVKAAPNKKRVRSDIEVVSNPDYSKKSCCTSSENISVEAEKMLLNDTEDNVEKESNLTPPSPVLQNKTRRNKKCSR